MEEEGDSEGEAGGPGPPQTVFFFRLSFVGLPFRCELSGVRFPCFFPSLLVVGEPDYDRLGQSRTGYGYM